MSSYPSVNRDQNIVRCSSLQTKQLKTCACFSTCKEVFQMTKSNVITCAPHICRVAEHEKWLDSSNQPHTLFYDHSCIRVESTLKVQLTVLSFGNDWGVLHMPRRRGWKSLKDGHCAFMAHSTLLTTLRNMAAAHKIFKRCWLYRDLRDQTTML